MGPAGDLVMADLAAVKAAGLAAAADAATKVRKGLDQSGKALAVAAGAVAASLSEFNNFGVDPDLISRITSAASNHGVAASDLLARLPGELEHYGTAAVDAFLKGGDALGKHWSHIESQFNAPQRAADPANGIWEDGSVNIGRNAADMSWLERVRASTDGPWAMPLKPVSIQLRSRQWISCWCTATSCSTAAWKPARRGCCRSCRPAA